MVSDKFTHFTNKISDKQEVSTEDSNHINDRDSDIADDCRRDCCDDEECCPDGDCDECCPDGDCDECCPSKNCCRFRGISIADVMQSLEDID